MSRFLSYSLKIRESPTLAAAELVRRLQRQGKRIIRFDCGDLLFDTPGEIKDAAYEGLRSGYTHYTSCRGIPELREAIADHLARWGVEADPESEIIVTPGAKFAIYAAMRATVDPGDEVILLSPSWPTYSDCADLAGGRAVFVSMNARFHVDEEALKGAIGERTKMLVVNTPNNPT
ncbi:TPA: aminotransferase class I/II-fold pyridoxal phosphate-dependent enzyme, partial [Candidatus Bathyarchaeota archaeon]|nr:aminotransferase class I/II-fold pyridoxal phosphate-dependent enzyme [Candidatus Bathyarchaeota archaeon]